MSFFLSIFCDGLLVDLSRDRIGGRRWKITEPIVVHICIRFRYHDDVANCHIEFTWTDTWMSIMESTFQFAFPLRHGTWMHRGPYFVCSQSILARLLSASLLRRLFSRFVESLLGFGGNEIDWLCYHCISKTIRYI